MTFDDCRDCKVLECRLNEVVAVQQRAAGGGRRLLSVNTAVPVATL